MGRVKSMPVGLSLVGVSFASWWFDVEGKMGREKWQVGDDL